MAWTFDWKSCVWYGRIYTGIASFFFMLKLAVECDRFFLGLVIYTTLVLFEIDIYAKCPIMWRWEDGIGKGKQLGSVSDHSMTQLLKPMCCCAWIVRVGINLSRGSGYRCHISTLSASLSQLIMRHQNLSVLSVHYFTQLRRITAGLWYMKCHQVCIITPIVKFKTLLQT